MQQRRMKTTICNREEEQRFVYFRLAKMAQGSQKFKAQRPGASKKHQQNKQKGPKKGGMNDKCYLLSSESLECI